MGSFRQFFPKVKVDSPADLNLKFEPGRVLSSHRLLDSPQLSFDLTFSPKHIQEKAKPRVIGKRKATGFQHFETAGLP